jgi:predicted AAA+ superfamily ATPase
VAPELLSKLRWFAEKLPELPVIAAGSLLDFALGDYPHSMPVGRIGYLYMEPLSFEEYLLAQGQKTLLNYLKLYSFEIEIPLVIHQQLLSLFREYALIGGMPAAVSSWASEKSLEKVSKIHHNLLTTYRNDFTKYRGRINIERLEEMLVSVPRMLGEKFIYSRVNPLVNAAAVQSALKLLMKARVCHKVVSTSANGVPIGAELNEKFFKMIFIDIGMVSAALGINFNELNRIEELIMVNKGQLAEQVVGQLLRTQFAPYVEPCLYYWLRAEKGSSSEIDYIVQHHNRLIPIEVKAGSTGSLKSLHLFMQLKKLPLAVRINSDLPSLTPVKVKDRVSGNIEYTLLSVPFYLMGQLHRLIDRVSTP